MDPGLLRVLQACAPALLAQLPAAGALRLSVASGELRVVLVDHLSSDQFRRWLEREFPLELAFPAELPPPDWPTRLARTAQRYAHAASLMPRWASVGDTLVPAGLLGYGSSPQYTCGGMVAPVEPGEGCVEVCVRAPAEPVCAALEGAYQELIELCDDAGGDLSDDAPELAAALECRHSLSKLVSRSPEHASDLIERWLSRQACSELFCNSYRLPGSAAPYRLQELAEFRAAQLVRYPVTKVSSIRLVGGDLELVGLCSPHRASCDDLEYKFWERKTKNRANRSRTT